MSTHTIECDDIMFAKMNGYIGRSQRLAREQGIKIDGTFVANPPTGNATTNATRTSIKRKRQVPADGNGDDIDRMPIIAYKRAIGAVRDRQRTEASAAARARYCRFPRGL